MIMECVVPPLFFAVATLIKEDTNLQVDGKLKNFKLN